MDPAAWFSLLVEEGESRRPLREGEARNEMALVDEREVIRREERSGVPVQDIGADEADVGLLSEEERME